MSNPSRIRVHQPQAGPPVAQIAGIVVLQLGADWSASSTRALLWRVGESVAVCIPEAVRYTGIDPRLAAIADSPATLGWNFVTMARGTPDDCARAAEAVLLGSEQQATGTAVPR